MTKNEEITNLKMAIPILAKELHAERKRANKAEKKLDELEKKHWREEKLSLIK